MSARLPHIGRLAKRLLGPQGARLGVLVSGASAAQVIPILVSPLLTRLYGPENYGVLAQFGAITAVLISVAAGRYQMAIMLPKTDEEAVHVTSLAITLLAISSGAVLIITLVLYRQLRSTHLLDPLGGWLLLIPLAMFLGGLYDVLTYFGVRHDRFTTIARASVTKAGAGAFVQVILGAFGAGVTGLITGALVSTTAGNRTLLTTYTKALRKVRTTRADLVRMAKRYSDFPKFELWANLANAVSYNVTVLAIGAIYSTTTLGQFALAYRMLALPSALLGTAVSQVYLRASALRRSDTRAALRAFDKTTLGLAGVSTVPFCIVLFFSADLFTIVFGGQWRTAGLLAAALAPQIWVRFVVSPVSTVFLVYERQRQLLFLQILLLGTTCTLLALAKTQGWTAVDLLHLQALFLGLLYIGILLMARRLVGRGHVSID